MAHTLLRICLAGLTLSALACGPERPPVPGSYTSATPTPGPSGRKDLPESAYRIVWTPLVAPAALAPGERFDLPVTFQNAGDVEWPATGRGDLYVVRLSQRWLRANGELVADYGALRIDLPVPVPAGQSTKLWAALVAPSVPGDYVVQFDLVHEGVTWFADRGAAKQFLALKVRQ
jgi:hypothetical protein